MRFQVEGNTVTFDDGESIEIPARFSVQRRDRDGIPGYSVVEANLEFPSRGFIFGDDGETPLAVIKLRIRDGIKWFYLNLLARNAISDEDFQAETGIAMTGEYYRKRVLSGV